MYVCMYVYTRYTYTYICSPPPAKHPDRLFCPSSLLFHGCRRLPCSSGKVTMRMQSTTPPQLPTLINEWCSTSRKHSAIQNLGKVTDRTRQNPTSYSMGIQVPSWG